MIRRLLPTLEATRRQILRQAKKQGASLADDAAFWTAQGAALYRAMIAAMEDGVLMGIDVGMAQLPIAVDWTLVNESAMRWAREYSYELIRNINGTTRRAIRQHITNWIESGDPLEALNQKLMPLLGRKRAELVASTEVTRAFAEGTERIAAASGLNIIPPREKPPKHPRCRCWMTLRQQKDGRWAWVWQTANDERVCPFCGPMHNKPLV